MYKKRDMKDYTIYKCNNFNMHIKKDLMNNTTKSTKKEIIDNP